MSKEEEEETNNITNLNGIPDGIYYPNDDTFGMFDIVNYKDDPNIAKTIEYYSDTDAIEYYKSLVTNGKEITSKSSVIENIDIKNLTCIKPYKDSNDSKIISIDSYINNDYCYVSFLKWYVDLDVAIKKNINNTITQEPQMTNIVCIGHSNKMKNLFETIINTRPYISAVPVPVPVPVAREVNETPSVNITFIRHGLSCNNVAGISEKDYDPSLTIYGMLTAIKKGEYLSNMYSKNDNINVCVSPLLRTWQTAILLFGKNYTTINLYICPYLTEAYADNPASFLTLGKVKKIRLGRGNKPIEHKWQMFKLYNFLKLLKKNNFDFGDYLETINIRFVDDEKKYSIFRIQNSDIQYTYKNENVDGGGFFSKTHKIRQYDKLNAASNNNNYNRIDDKTGINTQLADLKEEYDNNNEHNLWELTLSINPVNKITKITVTEGVEKPRTDGKTKDSLIPGKKWFSGIKEQSCRFSALGIVPTIKKIPFAVKRALSQKKVIPKTGGVKKSSRKTRRKSRR